MIARWLARVYYAGSGAILWSAPGYLVGWLAEPAWAYVFFPLLAYGAWRGATVSVREVRGGLVVRNTLRTYDLAWSDVAEVVWSEVQDGRLAGPVGYAIPRLTVLDRRRDVPVLAMACWMGPSREAEATTRRWAECVRP